MSNNTWHVAYLGRDRRPYLAGPFGSEDSAVTHLNDVVIGPGLILAERGDALLPVVAWDAAGTEYRYAAEGTRPC